MLRIWKGPGDFSPKTFSLMLAALFTVGFMWFADTQVAYATITVTKSANVSQALVGDMITFTINVSHTDVAPGTLVVIEDILIPSTGPNFGADCSLGLNTTANNAITYSIAPGYITETMQILGVTGTTSYICPVTVDKAIDFTNTLTYSKGTNINVLSLVTPTLFVPIDIVDPSIVITKAPLLQNVEVDKMAIFTITVKNTGDITLTDVIISDLPASNCNNGPYELKPGQSESYSCEVTVTDSFTNIAQINAIVDIDIPRPITSAAQVVAVNIVEPLVQIIKIPTSQIVNAGDMATFTITVTNTGDITLTNVIISDPLAPICGNGKITLGPGESIGPYTCEITVTDSFTNIAQVDAVVDTNIPRPITDTAQAAVTAIPNGQEPICVEGVVINHREKLVSGVPLFAQLFKGTPPILTTSDDQGKFKFDIPYAGLWEFGLRDFGLNKFPEDWMPVTSGLFNVDLEAGQDACYQIRFKIKRVRKVKVTKVNDAYKPLKDWIIKATPGVENNFAEVITATTDISGTAIFTLTEGLWIFTEEVPLDSDISYIPIIPRNGVQELTIDAERAYTDTYTIYFKNRIVSEGACIDIHKKDSPENFGIQGWYMEVLRMDGTLAAMGYTDIEGNLTVEGLPSGPYTVVEEERLGWAPVSSPRVDVTAIAGATCEKVTFTNKQEPPVYCIEGRKIDINGRYGLPDWEITIKPLAENDDLKRTVKTDGLGRYRFEFPSDDYRIPGSAYEICEVQQNGWVTAFTSECQVVYLPQEPGACVQAPDFVNAQVGHDLTQYYTLPSTATPTPVTPTVTPTAIPTDTPTATPYPAQPTVTPTAIPTDTPIATPYPAQPTVTPTAIPTETPTVVPPTATLPPTATPTDRPNGQQGGPAGKVPPGSKSNGASAANNGPAYTQVSSHDPGCRAYHIVQPGEGLSTVAAQYGLYHRDMLRSNTWVSTQKNSWVYPGQQLCVPYH